MARALPDKQIRMIGAWCFLDHYGPEDVSGAAGMQVWAHPHTGLQTVSWLFDGETSTGTASGPRRWSGPGDLNIMTAGHGIVHSEISPPDKPPMLHGVQLWVALPEAVRTSRTGVSNPYRSAGRSGVRACSGQVLLGRLTGYVAGPDPLTARRRRSGARCPARTPRSSSTENFEYGAFVVAGSSSDRDHGAVDQLLYLGTNRRRAPTPKRGGSQSAPARRPPFAEEIVMWWNFVGRSHDEIVAFREAWETGGPRFPPVVSRAERVMEAPPCRCSAEAPPPT